MSVQLSKIIHLLFLLIFFLKTPAQTYNFKNYNTDQGLAQSQVLSIFQDNKGYMWFGTNSGGASKFDGRKFYTISKNDGLIDNDVYAIVQNEKDEILFGTTKGLSVYNGFSFDNYGEKEGLIPQTIYKLLQDGEKTWIGTPSGVYIYQNKHITFFDKDSTLSQSTVWSIFIDKDKNMWFATHQNGVIFYDIKKKIFKHINKKNGLSSNFVFSIAQKDDGQILVGTQTGLNSIDKSFTARPVSQIRANINISFSNIYNNGYNHFYFGTFSEGLIEYNYTTNTLKAFNSSNGLTNNMILPIYKDREGNLWIGTDGNGVYKYYNTAFIYYLKENGLPNNLVQAVNEDTKGNLWLSISGNGLSRISGKTITNYKAEFGSLNALPDNAVKAILCSKNGKVYFGTESGLCVFENDKFKIIRSAEFDNKYILSLYEDSKGKIWVGTNEGVYSISNNLICEEKAINAYKKEGLLFLILFINEDKKGNLLFGLENGLMKYDGKNAVLFNDQKGFVKSKFSSGVKDYKGNFWFGTADGLYVYRDDAFQKILKKDSSSLGFITFLQPGRNKKLVIGTNQEIEILDLNKYYEGALIFKHLGKEDGLLSKESNFNASAMDRKGRILIGTGNGLEIYDPTSDHMNVFEPLTNITSVKLFFGMEDILEYCDGTDSTSFLPKNLILPHSKNNLSFQFIGISLVGPEKVKYKYKLQGLDLDWTPQDIKTEAIYPAIPPGNYTFMIESMNNDGIWNKKPVSFEFRILPPWYMTWWFRILAVSFIIIGAWLYVKFREKQLIREKVALEKIVKERTAEISQQKFIIEEKQNEILDSINYAQRIQRALLASKKLLKVNLPDYFIFFQPKDVVSGDFYWASLLSNGQFALVTADSTGHGVPGAIMSMLNISCLNDSVESKRLIEPKDILNNTRQRIIDHLANDGSLEGGKDGMDCSLISFDFKKGILTYSAANNPVWIVRQTHDQKIIIELEYNKMPVGKHDRDRISFIQHEVSLQKGDIVYTFTDGLPDQFGGAKEKKFMYKKQKELLLSISHLAMNAQEHAISEALKAWKGELEQVDDILVIGVRIS